MFQLKSFRAELTFLLSLVWLNIRDSFLCIVLVCQAEQLTVCRTEAGKPCLWRLGEGCAPDHTWSSKPTGSQIPHALPHSVCTHPLCSLLHLNNPCVLSPGAVQMLRPAVWPPPLGTAGKNSILCMLSTDIFFFSSKIFIRWLPRIRRADCSLDFDCHAVSVANTHVCLITQKWPDNALKRVCVLKTMLYLWVLQPQLCVVFMCLGIMTALFIFLTMESVKTMYVHTCKHTHTYTNYVKNSFR